MKSCGGGLGQSDLAWSSCARGIKKHYFFLNQDFELGGAAADPALSSCGRGIKKKKKKIGARVGLGEPRSGL